MTADAPALHTRTLRLFRGYGPGDHPPADAYDAGLRARFAVEFETLRSDAEGMFLDVELFLRLVAALLTHVPHDDVVYETTASPTRNPLLPADLASDLIQQPAPRKIVATRRDRPACVVETTCQVRLGGPGPYRDAYTAAFYTPEDLADAFAATCERLGGEFEAQLAPCEVGVPQRQPFVPLWRRPLRWIGLNAW